MRVRRFLLLLCLAALGPSPAAYAQPVPKGQEGALAAVVPPQHGKAACFARTYDALHLRNHPKQTVTSMLFRIRYHNWGAAERDQRNYYFTMAVQKKGRAKTLRTSGECTPKEGGFHCGLDCDGGGVDVKHDPAANTLTIDLQATGRIRMTDGCSEEESAVDLTPGADDKAFRLDKVDLAACRSIAK